RSRACERMAPRMSSGVPAVNGVPDDGTSKPPGTMEWKSPAISLTGVGDSPLLVDLNPVQREAVSHSGGPLLIVAGAGSGKTRVLTHRVAWLIRELGISPFAILAITFTNKAADEMKSRVAALVGPV